MRKLIEMSYDEETSLVVAVDVNEELMLAEATRDMGLDLLKGTPEKVEKNFGIVSGMILRCSKPIVESLERLGKEEVPPKKAKAEFSLSFSARGDVYLVENSLGGSIKVSFEWEF